MGSLPRNVWRSVSAEIGFVRRRVGDEVWDLYVFIGEKGLREGEGKLGIRIEL